MVLWVGVVGDPPRVVSTVRTDKRIFTDISRLVHRSQSRVSPTTTNRITNHLKFTTSLENIIMIIIIILYVCVRECMFINVLMIVYAKGRRGQIWTLERVVNKIRRW